MVNRIASVDPFLVPCSKIYRVRISIDAKLPNRFSGWGVTIRSDIEIYLDVLEFIHATAGREGVKILFRVLSGYSKGSELPVNAQIS